ncbi:hypothetical protein [Winogradskyella ursingii]|uniref:hypothetical protein n=1 Tax=Winogradskyella ursingii TaxID=2686079 RepID=UPI0015C7A67D|nr:hypothetical protein [Winogradskyella ursingii]
MSEKLPKESQNEEVDLGQLFKIIGDAFNRLIKFIGSIFKVVFDVIILFLLFIQKHLVKFAIVGIIGFLVGYFVDTKTETRYISTMVLEPNFNSVQQLYNNIDFYNELAEAEDSTALAEALNIPVSESAFIKEFSVESYSDENQKILLFDRFVRSLDTTTQKAIDIEAYLENFNSYDARFHTVSVIATDKMIAKKSQPAIINSISKNEYFNLQKDISEINIQLQDSLYKKQIVEIDSLQLFYKKVMMKELDRPMEGTTISLGENGTKENKEIALIDKMEELKTKLVELNNQRANKSNILNVISDFPSKGVEVHGITESYKFILPLFLVSSMLLFFMFLSLNTYLTRYKKNRV